MKWMKRIFLAIILIVIGAGGYGLADHLMAPSEEKEQVSDAMSKLSKAQKLILDSYVEEISPQELMDGAVRGMVMALKDPYSVYMDKETSRQFEQSLDSSFSGIGAELTQKDEGIVVVSPFKDSPADRAGLKPNDKIRSVDGKPVEGLTLYDVTAKIRGPKGSKVQLEVERGPDKKVLTFTMEREDIPVETVHHDVFPAKKGPIGYLEITSFGEKTADDVKAALGELEEQGISGLIVDVRDNPGGLLSSVEEILHQFVTKKKPFMHIEERSGKREALTSPLESKKTYPVVALMNEGSASAAEILVAGLQEVEGYPLIGSKSFGKGTVQQTVGMGDGSEIKLTMFKWLTPNKKWIHKKGISPTHEVEQSPVFHLLPLQSAVVLKKGMNDERVSRLQEMLTGLGYPTDRLDGYFSEKTEAAVRQFQEKKRVKVTGEVNSATIRELEKAIEAFKDDPKQDAQLQAALSLLKKES